MDVLTTVIDFFLHLDDHLVRITADYGTLSYLFLFGVVFLETGLVITPFLPGDSLLFAAGTIAALKTLDVGTVWLVLFAAAVIGDNVNYVIGRTIGSSLAKNGKLVKPKHIERTHRFFERYGKSAIILARFVPIVRTFVPFVAGIGRMTFRAFMVFNVVGALLWVSLFVFGGYFFGNMHWVKENFHVVTLAIILISLAPMIVEVVRYRRTEKKQSGKEMSSRQ